MGTTDVERGFDTNENVRKQAQLKLWHPGCWTLEVTQQHTDAHLVVKSAYRTDNQIKADVLVVASDGERLAALLDSIEEHPVVDAMTVLKRTHNRARIVVNYDRSSSISPRIINSDFMPIKPVYITGGYEYWTVMIRTDQFGSILQEMQDEFDVEMVTISGFDVDEDVEFEDVVDRVYSDLSPRQLECFLTAVDTGYYEWPRNVSANGIAEDLGISGPTFLEHLRKAEQKAIIALVAEMDNRHGQIGRRPDHG